VPTVTSPDGTTIAYEHTGQGPALVLVDGAMCYRAAGPMRPLATRLQDRFTVTTYDRRGRGESTDTLPYHPDREVEDLRAVIERAGGQAFVCAMSSGGALALATATSGPGAAASGLRSGGAKRGSDEGRRRTEAPEPARAQASAYRHNPGVAGLVIYEPPFLSEFDDAARFTTYSRQLVDLLDAGRRGDAVALFMAHVGVPAQAIAGMRGQPAAWAPLEAIAPTLAYDDRLLDGSGVPRERAAAVTVPALVVSGGASPAALQLAAKATAEAIPGGQHRTLDGQTHDVDPDALAAVVVDFLG
jgi:pimeloyl-ACP methyl ester carboxylesterase